MWVSKNGFGQKTSTLTLSLKLREVLELSLCLLSTLRSRLQAGRSNAGTSPAEPPVKRSLKAVCNFNSATVYECLCWLVVWLPFLAFSH